jgi:hypothetical protein
VGTSSPSKIQAEFAPLASATPIRKVRSRAETYKAPFWAPKLLPGRNNLNLRSEMVAVGAILIIGIIVAVFPRSHLHTRPSGAVQ